MRKRDFDGYDQMKSWLSAYPASDYMMPEKQGNVIPEKFDLRDVGAASPLKDKGKTPEGIGICWLFAGIAALESHLLYTKTAAQEDPLYIQSELHGAYATFDISEGDPEYENPRGRNPMTDSAGKPLFSGWRYMAVNYLTLDTGTVPECLDPYHKEDIKNGILQKRKWDLTSGKPGRYYVKEVRYLPEPVAPDDPVFLMQIKNYIFLYGGVVCSISWSDKFINRTGTEEYTYFNDGTEADKGGHAVTIMGWDDNYPVANFKTPPKNPGAFLVKNCWAAEPAGGYFWISYESEDFYRSAYCVTRAAADFYTGSYRVLQHARYGYNDLYIPFSDGVSRTAKAKNVFSALQGDSLAGVSFYACTGCYVTITCSITTETLVENYPCPTPGYYTYDLPVPVSLPEGKFEVIVEYLAARNLPAYIPLEVNDSDDLYPYWTIESGKSYVFRNGGWTDVVKLEWSAEDNEYGYFCMKAIIKSDSDVAKKRREIYDELAAPVLYHGYSSLMEESRKGETLHWRTEPYHASEYSSTYSSDVKLYRTEVGGKDRYGLVNTGTKEERVWLVATIGSGEGCLRKIFCLDIGVTDKNYGFTCSEVKKYEITSTISGSFGIPGAVVTVSANGRSESVSIKADGTWELKDFSLYNAFDGWKDEYGQTEVRVEIKSADNLLLSEGVRTVALSNPAEKDSDGNWLVWTAAGLITAVAAGGTIFLCCDITCGGGTAAAGAVVGAGASGVVLSGNGAIRTIETAVADDEIPLLGEAHRVDGIVRRYANHHGMESRKVAEETRPTGGLVNKISAGGVVRNCGVTGKISGGNGMGALFCEGEDVTVENCSIDLDVENCTGVYAGVAVSLSGSKSLISNVSVKGTIHARRVAGLIDTMEGGKIQKVGVEMDVETEEGAGGVLGTGKNAEVVEAVISETVKSGGVAAGVALSADGGNIRNCRVSGKLSGSEGAFGIAGSIHGGSKIENCYSACCLSADGPEAAACGITGSFEDSACGISGCVSVGSHYSAKKTARISLQDAENCIAYDSMTSSGNFESGGEKLETADSFLDSKLYESLGWDSSIWEMDEEGCFPKLKEGKIGQSYDYPFLYPQPPQSGQFEYCVGQVVAITGKKNNRASGITWSLAPHLGGNGADSGEYMEKGDDFYIQIAALPTPGDYDLALISLLDGQKYGKDVRIQVTGENSDENDD